MVWDRELFGDLAWMQDTLVWQYVLVIQLSPYNDFTNENLKKQEMSRQVLTNGSARKRREACIPHDKYLALSCHSGVS